MATAAPSFRADIQALRGLAVLFVLIYHAKVGVLPGGYLGVDIFFVISGYLITGIVLRGIEDHSFSFLEFYIRRARRLLPVAYVVLFGTTILSFFLLSSIQFSEYCSQLTGSVLFVANIVLWSQTGYFSESAYMKPLLHMWSLSVEEQYYLGLPLALLLTPARHRLIAVALVSVVSFASSIYLVSMKPSITFFMLPTRLWELGIGSLGAFFLGCDRLRLVCAKLVIPAIVTLFAIPSFPLNLPHPGMNALIVCLATLIVIVSQSPAISSHIVTNALARMGDFSYSLYLVHFPLYALARSVYLDVDLPVSVTFLIFISSIAISYALYRHVELPWRYKKHSPSALVVRLLLAGAFTLVLPLGLARLKEPPSEYAAVLRPNHGLGCQAAEGMGHFYNPRCAESSAPKILIWGDSLAAHLVPAITGATTDSVSQASYGMCAPVENMAAIQNPSEVGFAQSCINYNRSVLEFLGRPNSPDVVVLTASYLRFYEKDPSLVIRKGGSFIVSPAHEQSVERAALQTVRRLQSLNKKLVIVSPPPQARFDVGRCWERRVQGIPMAGPYSDCVLEMAELNPWQPKVIDLLTRVSSASGVPLVRLDHLLCNGSVCMTTLGPIPLYRDETHLTDEGSAALQRRLKLGKLIVSAAN